MDVCVAKRMAGAALVAVLLVGVRPLAADSPDAVLSPDQFRESISDESLRGLGFTPEKYTFDVPLTGGLSMQRQYLRAGGTGLFSSGLAERSTDALRFSLNRRGLLQLTQDQATSSGPSGLFYSLSRKRTGTLTQSFGAGTWTGQLALSHDDTCAEDAKTGTSRLQNDSATLQWGLGKSLALTAGALSSTALAQTETRTARLDAAIGPPGGAGPALAEYHRTDSQVGAAVSRVTQLAVRAPTLKVAEVPTNVALSQVQTEIPGVYSQVDNTVSVTAQPAKPVTVTATHLATDRSAGGDSHTNTFGSQIRVLPDTTVSAAYSDTQMEGVGLSSQKSVELAKTPVDGKGLGLRAAYTHIDVPGGTLVDPTVHVQVDYTTSATWAVHGLYHDDSVRPKPEVSGAVQVPLFGGALGLNYSEYVLDPVTQIVRLSRIYGAEVSRPIAWGLTGKVGYQYLDSLAGDSLTGRTFQVALGGESRTIGRLDLQYQTAQMRAPMGRLPDTSSLAITLTRPLGSLGDIALTGRRTVAAPGTIPLPTDNQFQLDVKRAF